MGDPLHNQQCYRKVSVMQEFVIGEKTALISDKDIKPLPRGRAIFYAIYPKFTNVDIRMTIDVFRGAVDLYVTNKENRFRVVFNHTTGNHQVIISAPLRSVSATSVQSQGRTCACVCVLGEVQWKVSGRGSSGGSRRGVCGVSPVVGQGGKCVMGVCKGGYSAGQGEECVQCRVNDGSVEWVQCRVKEGSAEGFSAGHEGERVEWEGSSLQGQGGECNWSGLQ